jgi:DNA polymerase-3 subunit gamma/tau
MSQALYRKWRPQLWDEVVGQEHIIQTLKNAVTSDRVAHAYLFAGPRGTGKTTTARLLAKAVNCLAQDLTSRPCNRCEHCQSVNQGRFLDLIEIDAASNTSVDDVRDLRDKINYAPSQGRYKVYIIDEVHMLSTAAFNALLKTLEEPPPHAIFILATTEIHKIPATVLSRCQRHEFRRIPINEITARLKDMAAAEKVSVDDEALTLIARQSTGSLRDAISLLDQLASTGKMIDLGLAQTMLGTATSQVVIDLVNALLTRKADSGMNLIHRALDAGSDPRQFARQTVDYLRNVLLVKMGNVDQVEATQDQRAQIARHAQGFDLPGLLETLRIFNSAAVDQHSSWHPGLALELAFVEAISVPASPPHPAPGTLVASTPVDSKPAAGVPPSSMTSGTGARSLAPAASAAQASPQVNPPSSHPATAGPRKVSQTAKPLEQSAPASQNKEATPAPVKEVNQEHEAPPAASTAGTTISLPAIAQNWKKIRDVVKKRKSQVDGLLNSCHPLGIKDGVLLLGFATDVLKSKMEMGDNLVLTRQAINQVLGVDIQVRCVISSGKAGGLPPDIDVENDGMVSTILRDLGGEIVDIH